MNRLRQKLRRLLGKLRKLLQRPVRHPQQWNARQYAQWLRRPGPNPMQVAFLQRYASANRAATTRPTRATGTTGHTNTTGKPGTTTGDTAPPTKRPHTSRIKKLSKTTLAVGDPRGHRVAVKTLVGC